MIEGWKICQKFVLMKFKVRNERKLHERQGMQLVAGNNESLARKKRQWVMNKKMKTICSMLVLSAISLWLTAFTVHPYYMSVTDIEYRSAQKEIQIACKIFTDDLEDALKVETKKPVTLTDGKDKAAKLELIRSYLQAHLKLMVDGKVVAYELIGFENEQEATWNYLLIKNVSGFKNVTVYNDLLFQLRTGQINIIHFKHKGETKSYRLTAPEAQHTFSW